MKELVSSVLGHPGALKIDKMVDILEHPGALKINKMVDILDTLEH